MTTIHELIERLTFSAAVTIRDRNGKTYEMSIDELRAVVSALRARAGTGEGVMRAKDIILCHATSAAALVEKAIEVSRTAPPSPAIEVVDSRVTVTASVAAASLRGDFVEYGPHIIKHRDHTAPRSPVRRFKKSSKR